MESLFDQLKPALIQRLLNQSEISSKDLDNLRVVNSFQEGKSGAEVLEVESFLGVFKIEGRTVLKISTQSPWPDYISEEERYQHLSQIQALFAKLVWSTTLKVSSETGELQNYTCTFWQRAHDQQPLHEMNQLNQLTQTEFSAALKCVGQRLVDAFSLDAQPYLRDVSFPSLCEGVLGYRLHPKQGRIYTFVQDHFQVSWKKPTFRWAGVDLPDPYYYAREAQNLKLSRVYQGDIHGDLHAGNIFAVLKNGNAQDICLIDAGLSASKQVLFYDQAYLEVSLLLQSVLAQQEKEKDWVQYLGWLSDLGNFELSDLHQKKGLHSEYLPLLTKIQALRSSFTTFLETKNSLSEDLRKQYHFQQICAALNFCNKPLDQISQTMSSVEKNNCLMQGGAQRRFSYLYAAFFLKSYLAKYGDAPEIVDLKQTLTRDPSYLYKLELRKREAYESIWRKWGTPETNQQLSIKELSQDYLQLRALKSFNRVPSSVSHYYANFFYRWIFVKKYPNCQSSNEKLQMLAMLALAVQDSFSHLSEVLKQDPQIDLMGLSDDLKGIELSKTNPENRLDWFYFAFLLIEDCLFLENEELFSEWIKRVENAVNDLSLIKHEKLASIYNQIQYYKAIKFALDQKIESLKEHLEQWKPEEDDWIDAEWCIKKAFLNTTLFKRNYQEGFDFLDSVLSQADKWPFQEQMYFFEGYDFIEKSFRHYSDPIAYIGGEKKKELNLQGFETFQTYLEKNIIPDIEKNNPYFNQVRIFLSGQDIHVTRRNASLNAMVLLFQLGFMPQVFRLQLISHETWHRVNLYLFKEYLQFSFFYLLRYLTVNEIDAEWVRIQLHKGLFVYNNESINEKIFSLTLSIYKHLRGEDNRLLMLIVAVLSEFILQIPETFWNEFFWDIWTTFNHIDHRNVLYSQSKQGPFFIIKNSLSRITDPVQLEECLYVLLETDGDLDADYYIRPQLLYEIIKNVLYQSIPLNERLIARVNDLVYKTSDLKIAYFAFAKLRLIEDRFLNSLHKEKIASHIQLYTDFPSFFRSTFAFLVLYTSAYPEARKNVHKLIIENGRSIWSTGIEKNKDGWAKHHFGEGSVKLHEYKYKQYTFPQGLQFNQTEILELYQALKESIQEFKQSPFAPSQTQLSTRLIFMSGLDFSLLKEMNYFIDDYADILKLEPDYQTLKEEIMAGIQEHAPSSGRPSDLTSDNPNTVQEGISHLRDMLLEHDFENFTDYWTTLLSKILLQQEPLLHTSLELMSYWLVYYRNEEAIKSSLFQNFYLQILDKYQANKPTSDYLEKIELGLVKISMVLRFWKKNSTGIDYFLGLRNTSKYESVKNLPELDNQDIYRPELFPTIVDFLKNVQTTDFFLSGVSIQGFKSFSNHHNINIKLRPLNVLVGANGAGKSSFFKFLEFVQEFSQMPMDSLNAKMGSISDLLYYGTKQTDSLTGSLTFIKSEQESLSYNFQCKPTEDFKYFYFESESITLSLLDQNQTLYESKKPQSDSVLFTHATQPWAKMLRELLGSLERIHIPDTSLSSKLRDEANLYDNKHLASDGKNLAAFLYALKNSPEEKAHYKQMIRLIRHAFPQFQEFVLEPNFEDAKIQLQWREEGSEYVFGAHQASDGSLRFMVLTALLMSPPHRLPRILILDEPELGLHPKALATLANMISLASQYCQILIATQSSELLDHFEADDLVIVDRTRFDLQTNEMKDKAFTVMTRKNSEELASWLEDYSLSELWNKNVLGGKP